MGISAGAAVFIQGIGHNTDVLEGAAMKHLDADALNEEFDLLVLEHRKANVTAVVVRLEECFDIFARVAARLARPSNVVVLGVVWD